MISRYVCPSLEFVFKHPNLPWNISELSSNLNISIDDILQNVGLVWNWVNVCSRSDLTGEHLDKFSTGNICWESSQVTKVISFSMFKKHLSENWDIGTVLSNTPRVIELAKSERHLNMEQFWQIISTSTKLPLKFIDKYSSKPWDWNSLSHNVNLTSEFIDKHSNKPWNYLLLFERDLLLINSRVISTLVNSKQWTEDISTTKCGLKVIELYHSLPIWDWNRISSNSNLTMEFIMKHPEKLWNWQLVSKNANISLKDVLENPHLPWDFDLVQLNRNIPVHEFIKYNREWSWDIISANLGVTETDIIMFDWIPWNHYVLTLNPNISLRFMAEHPNQVWNFKQILVERFTEEREEMIKKIIEFMSYSTYLKQLL